MKKFNINEEEKNRIRLLHINESDKRFNSTLLTEKVDGWWGKLFGGRKRIDNIFNDLKSKGALEKVGENSLRKFAKVVNKAHKYFVSESGVLKAVKDIYLGLDDLNFLTKLTFQDSTVENKPETFVDLLIAGGNFSESQKVQLDNKLETALSDLVKSREKLNLPKEGRCSYGDTNPYDKEKQPDKWNWCQTRLNKYNNLNEINRVREIMGLEIISEQEKGQVIIQNGKRFKVVDLINAKLPETNIGQDFESAVYKLTKDSLKKVKNLAVEMVDFFKDPSLQGITFEIELNGGASLVPIPDSTAKSMGIPGYQNLSSDKRNLWLANKRAESVKNYLQNALNQAGIKNVTIPDATVTLGKTPWDPVKKANHPDYKAEQFMNIKFVPTGSRAVLEELPSFCEKEFPKVDGEQGNKGNNWRVYPGKGMKLDLGPGEGMITLDFDAKIYPDMFILKYNNKRYVSENPKTGKKGFVSGLFKQLSDKELEGVAEKLEKIKTEVTPLQERLKEAKETLKLGEEELRTKLTERLLEQDKKLEETIKLINQKIEKYGYNLPLDIKFAEQKSRSRMDKYIEYFFPYLDKNVPNVYWSEQLIDSDADEFERLSNAYYNLSKEGALDKQWFESFFQQFPYDRKYKEIKKSTGYKKLRKAGKGVFDKDDILNFFKKMRSLQKTQVREQDKKREEMKKEIKTKTRELEKRKKDVQNTIEEEIKSLQEEISRTTKEINKQLSTFSSLQTEYEYNMATKGGYGTSKAGGTDFFNKKLREKGFKQGIIGNNGSITFNKVYGEDIAYLQVIAPIGGTIWDAKVRCGKDAEKKETSSE